MSLRCIVVTPEKTELDCEANAINLPMFDGSLGVLAGPQKYFVDGGFAQVEDNVVNLLTERALPVDMLDVGESEKVLVEALELPSNTPELAAIKATAVLRARCQLRSAR